MCADHPRFSGGSPWHVKAVAGHGARSAHALPGRAPEGRREAGRAAVAGRLAAALPLCLTLLWAFGAAAAPKERIVTLGFSATELVYAIGLGDQVVGVDASTLSPPAALELPKVDYYRRVGAEGVLSLRPTLVVASHEAGPEVALEQMAKAGVRVIRLPPAADLPQARAQVAHLANAVDREEEGKAVVSRLDAAVAKAAKARGVHTPKVLFLFSPTASVLTVAGKETPAASMIEQAGGRLAVDAYTGFRPLGQEALVASRPDVILVTTRTLASLGGEARLWEIPGVALTPAGRAKRVIALDDALLLSYGPKAGEAILTLAEALAELGELPKP